MKDSGSGFGMHEQSYLKSRYQEIWKHPASQMLTPLGKMPVIFGKWAEDVEVLKEITKECVVKRFLSPHVAYLWWQCVMSYYRPLVVDHIQHTVLQDNPSAVMGVLSANEGVGITKKDEVAEVISACQRLQGVQSIADIDRRCRGCGQQWRDIKRMNEGKIPRCPIYSFGNAFFDIINPPPPNTYEALRPLFLPDTWIHIWFGVINDKITELKKAYYKPVNRACDVHLRKERFQERHPVGMELMDIRLQVWRLAVAFRTLCEEGVYDDRVWRDLV